MRIKGNSSHLQLSFYDISHRCTVGTVKFSKSAYTKASTSVHVPSSIPNGAYSEISPLPHIRTDSVADERVLRCTLPLRQTLWYRRSTAAATSSTRARSRSTSPGEHRLVAESGLEFQQRVDGDATMTALLTEDSDFPCAHFAFVAEFIIRGPSCSHPL